MNNQINYQKKLDAFLEELTSQNLEKPKHLFLHSCCAPCSSYVLEYLSQYMEITVFYYNPNISPEKEYQARVEEQKRLITEQPHCYPVHFQAGDYIPQDFYQAVKGHETDSEGGERCFICYELRLREAAKLAKEGGYDYFTTTLSISPLKNAAKLNEIGEKLSQEYDIPYLYSDFKKKSGYKRSIELSAEYKLYRQNYCGCVFSKREAGEPTESV
ncbi:MAG: epoxyqueuosine reductase QueH [Lachnospiraceae bacterium]|nr:epoxyqueuosine reductase QueH [Lachnospiraceae bacterium]